MNMNALIQIQSELKVPKTQYNQFGNYYFRNCEDILESVKPLLKKYNCYLIITDDIVYIGERFYVKATVSLYDENNKKIGETSAFAREPETVKGQSEAQVTGASSSYARKYALNGLFDIDDTKDSDTTNQGEKTEKKPKTSTGSTSSNSLQNMTLEEAETVCFANGNSANVPFGQLRTDQLQWIAEKSKGKYKEAAEIILESRLSKKIVDSDDEIPF